MEQFFVFKGLGETSQLQHSLKSAQEHSTTTHKKIVYGAWLQYEGFSEDGDFSMTCIIEESEPLHSFVSSDESMLEEIVFQIGSEKISCRRQLIAALSRPFHAMLKGCFSESGTNLIDFSHNGISVAGMRAVEIFSRTGRLETETPDVVIEVLSLANSFFCEKLKAACDATLSATVHNLMDAAFLVDCAVEQNSQLLIAVCLKTFLLELPSSLKNLKFQKLFSDVEGRMKLQTVGHCSYALYALLSQASMENDISLDICLSLVEHLKECAVTPRQQLLALHRYGCVMLARKNYMKAENSFEEAAKLGHAYSITGVARAKYYIQQHLAAYTEMSAIISCFKPSGWMYEERSLYSRGKDKLADLDKATHLDPKLHYPYKYRTVQFLVKGKFHEAFTEINKVLKFDVSCDLLDVRACVCLALHDFASAVRDLRVILTLDSEYRMTLCSLSAREMLDMLTQKVSQWTKENCWVQLVDLWSSLDYIGCVSIIHQMLESEPGTSSLFFRQSVLLSRLDCSKAAYRSLRLAQENAIDRSEELLYGGWLSYWIGHRSKALQKADESIQLKPSFQGFFLKAHIISDKRGDAAYLVEVVSLLKEALKHPCDSLQKGQALNDLANAYLDSGKFELATTCYQKAFKAKHTRALQGLAQVHLLHGDLEATFHKLTEFVETTINNADGFEARSCYGPRCTATADLAMVTLINPLRLYPYKRKASAFMDTHQEVEAMEELSKVIAFKADPQLLQLRAAFHELMGDTSQAFRDCRAALAMCGRHRNEVDFHHYVHI